MANTAAEEVPLANATGEELQPNKRKRRSSEDDALCGAPAAKYRELYADGEAPFQLEDFSDEVLTEIFQYLDSWSLLTMMNCFKCFQTLLLDRRFWNHIDLGQKPLPLGMLEDVLERTSANTRCIKLHGPSQGEPLEGAIRQFCTTLATSFKMRCTNLCVLELQRVTIDFTHLGILNFPKTLRRLIFNDCTVREPNKVSFYGIDTHMKQLEELGIENCDWFEPYFIMIFSKVPALRWLSLKGCRQLAEFVPYGSMAARFGFKTLEHLDLRFTPITDSDLQCFNVVSTLKEILLDCPENMRHDPAQKEAQPATSTNAEAHSDDSQPSTSSTTTESSITSEPSTSAAAASSVSSSDMASISSLLTGATAASDSASPVSSSNGRTTADEAAPSSSLASAAMSSPFAVVISEIQPSAFRSFTASTAASLNRAAAAAAAATVAATASESAPSSSTSAAASGSPSTPTTTSASAARTLPAAVSSAPSCSSTPATGLAAGSAAASPEVPNGPSNNDRPLPEYLLPVAADQVICLDVNNPRRPIIIHGVPRRIRNNHNNHLDRVVRHPLFWNLIDPLARNPASAAAAAAAAAAGTVNGPLMNLYRQWRSANTFEGGAPLRSRYAFFRNSHPISDRGLCCFGRPQNPVEQGVIWIRIGNRPSETNIVRLSVRNYKLVTDISLQHLVQCSPQLRFLDLSGTSVTRAGIDIFLQRKPSCHIIAEHLSYDNGDEVADNASGGNKEPAAPN